MSAREGQGLGRSSPTCHLLWAWGPPPNAGTARAAGAGRVHVPLLGTFCVTGHHQAQRQTGRAGGSWGQEETQELQDPGGRRARPPPGRDGQGGHRGCFWRMVGSCCRRPPRHAGRAKLGSLGYCRVSAIVTGRGLCPGPALVHGALLTLCSRLCACLGIKTVSKRNEGSAWEHSGAGRTSGVRRSSVQGQDWVQSCLFPGRVSKFPRNVTLWGGVGGCFTSQRNTSTRTDPESEQVCSGMQAPAPGPPAGGQRVLALRGRPVSCCASSVIPTGPGLSPQWRLGRAGLASSGVGVGRGCRESSQSRLSFGQHLCPEARGPNLLLEPAARLCTCSCVSCPKSHTCIHFALSSW